MALHFLSKMKILVVRDIEREDIEFISKVCVCVCVCTYMYVHACEFLCSCIWGKIIDHIRDITCDNYWKVGSLRLCVWVHVGADTAVAYPRGGHEYCGWGNPPVPNHNPLFYCFCDNVCYYVSTVSPMSPYSLMSIPSRSVPCFPSTYIVLCVCTHTESFLPISPGQHLHSLTSYVHVASITDT